MTETREIVVKTMPHAYVTPDASIIQLEFADTDGQRTKLTFSAADFEEFMVRAIELFTHARNQKLASGGHLAIHAARVVEAGAQAPIGGGNVILGLRTDNGLLSSFSLPPGKADRLRKELYDAARSARKQSSQSRH